MKKIILVRYGEYDENNHLNENGKNSMILVSEKLKKVIENQKTIIISADIDRAFESAKIISENLNVDFYGKYKEFYAAEEENINVDIDKAIEIINSFNNKCDILLLVISREYIEEIPEKILNTNHKINLQRGGVLIIDLVNKNLNNLKSLDRSTGSRLENKKYAKV